MAGSRSPGLPHGAKGARTRSLRRRRAKATALLGSVLIAVGCGSSGQPAQNTTSTPGRDAQLDDVNGVAGND